MSPKIGSLAWLRQTQGRMSLASRLALLRQVLAPAIGGMAKTYLRLGQRAAVQLDQIPLPDTADVKHALEELESCASNSVIQHSFRTYLWGAGFGQVGRFRYDPEFLLVSCLLHDLGMTGRHHGQFSSCRCFAGDSALAAAALMRRAGWDEARADALADAICLHMNGHITPADGVEAHLLQQGTACDVAGSRYFDFRPAFREAVLQRHPRDGFNRTMTAFMAKEKALRPMSRAALMHQVGLPLMIRLNPYAE